MQLIVSSLNFSNRSHIETCLNVFYFVNQVSVMFVDPISADMPPDYKGLKPTQ